MNDSDYMEDGFTIDARSLTTLETLEALERGGWEEVKRMARLGRSLMADAAVEEPDWNSAKEDGR